VLVEHLPLVIVACSLALKQTGAVLATGLHPGPAFVVTSVTSSLGVVAVAALFRGRAQLAVALAVDLVITLLVWTDVLYYRQFFDVPTVGVIRTAGLLREEASIVTSLMRGGDALLFADLLLVPLVLRRRALWRAPLSAASWRRVAATIALSCAACGVVVRFDPYRHHPQKGRTYSFKRWGTVTYHVVDALRYAWVRLRPAQASPPEVAALAQELRARQQGLPATELFGVARGRSLIVVQVESLQQLALDADVGGEPVMPRLRALRQQALSFPRFHHQVSAGVTSDADLLMNCSLYPLSYASAYVEFGDGDFRCLAHVLAQQGYATAVFQGIRPDFWNASVVYPRVGYARFDSIKDFVQDDVVGHGISDESFFRQSIDKLAGLPEPFFAFLITLTSHAPYERGDPLPPGIHNERLARYLAAQRYTDRGLGILIDGLRARGLLDRAVMVVYGDHFGVRVDSAAELLPETATAVDRGATEAQVSLLVRLPGGAGAGVRERLGGQVDLAPTLLGLLGLTQGFGPFFGRSLLEPGPARVVFADGSARDDRRWFEAGDAVKPSRCLEVTSGAELPPDDCAELAADASRELALGRRVIEDQLSSRLAAPAR